jgi:predicted amidohydrolase YtcJ
MGLPHSVTCALRGAALIKRRALALILSQFAACLAAAAGLDPPDLILFNGKIFTSVASHAYVQAVAVRGERVAATGDSKDVLAAAGPKTRRIDLGGRTVIPGINDAHDHLNVSDPNTVEVRFNKEDPNWEEAREALIEAAAKASKQAILTGEVGPAIYFDQRVDRAALDRISPDVPIVLDTLTGHATFLNSAALGRLGIAENTPDPVAGRYGRGADGKLNGIVREYATLQLNRTRAGLATDADGVIQLRAFLADALQFGITTIQDMSDTMTPDRCASLLAAIPTPIRIRIMRMPGTTVRGRDTTEGQKTPRHFRPLIEVNGTKWMLDGTPIEGTLSTAQPWRAILYASPDEAVRTLPLSFPESEIRAMLRESLQNRDPLLLHVSGYPAAAALLGAMQATGGERVWKDKRVRIEHGDGLFPDLQARARSLGVLVVQNPTHFAALEVPGPHAAVSRSQPLRSLLDAGIPVALGSDGPINPFLNIMFASTHPSRPSEAITREQAVIAYTLTSAYAEFEEKNKGSLEPGKLADLAVLSQDIFTLATQDLRHTKSLLTLVGGKIVYDAHVLN